ncbi:linear amide C-N hydrolase [Legionella israelensis]|uniref:Choloylglycine hydrolase n=1 Tax=Legionella israelensis TaxID=454 RepID=A0A0W0WG64_9GAMM|nr:linear amide C-N hydrolase [Legionella israelensis]KTD31337.1 choloylglycine hydrolase [Legionella israelensis]QBS09716.1 linear amide C-N hydrolase [Legionella israelensis]SCY14873.1 choloylglycine hydrolase [Legionella israelensis DSM 19235]STX59245.1 choloylglycine hydrolase [Legionella israelensis]
MCTRTLFVGDDHLVITGRNMDWKEDMLTNLYIFPAYAQRSGSVTNNPIEWISKYGSVIAAGYDSGSVDGMNEKGLVANLLYLVESSYPSQLSSRPDLSISMWLQYVLDNFSSVKEAVNALSNEPFNLIPVVLPNGDLSPLHLSISDSTGDSAIFEYISGKLCIHHDTAYKVMTNSPPYEQQIILNEYWKQIGGLTFLPGTNRASDRFVRASFLLDAIPKTIAPQYINSIPKQSFRYQAVAEVLSLMRAVSVPLGITTPEQPNISSTIWRTVSDQTNLVYYFDSATRPNAFWVDFANLKFNAGAPIKKLSLQNGEIYAGEVSSNFQKSELFRFLSA